MKGKFGTSRAIEASTIDYITEKVAEYDWQGVAVEKTFKNVYEGSIPAICVRVGNTVHEKVELGSDSTVRTPVLLIDIFAHSDCQRLDLKDFLLSILRNGWTYYEYYANHGKVVEKNEVGRIRVESISDTVVFTGDDKSTLDPHDQFRHLLSLEISLGIVEDC